MVNGHVATFEQIIKDGDVIEHLSHRHEPPVTHKNIDIIYQDDDIVVINKPSGIPVHPAGRYRHNSITHIMMAEMACNRLDRLTSGLMILARNVRIADEMRKKMYDRRILKEYICKVHGQPLTGRTHQLRVHLQWLGNPILNDPIYANMKIWGSDMGKKGSFMLNDDELISSLTKMGKTETASWYMDEIEEAEKRRESRLGELLTGEVCNICQAPLYSDPSQNDLKIYLHAWKYKSDDNS
ncbi:unnamed protein product, partial [Pneumocystis jirovecii]